MLCGGLHCEEMYSWEMHCEEMHSGKILSKGVESDDKHIVHLCSRDLHACIEMHSEELHYGEMHSAEILCKEVLK